MICSKTKQRCNNDFSLSSLGEPMLLQLCQSAKVYVSELISSFEESLSDASAKEIGRADSTEKRLTLVELDHMRNKAGYIKILSKWADQLCSVLVIHLLHRKRKRFLLKLWGTEDNIKVFLRNLKTHAVDVDSSGKPCKEKLATVLCSCLSGIELGSDCPSTKGLRIEEIESEPQLKTLFKRYNLSQVYDEYVDC